MFINKEQEVETIEVGQEVEVEQTKTEPTTDNSTIKEMRKAMKEKDKEIAALKEDNNKLSSQQSQLDKLVEKDLINTYGNDNLEDAKKLLDAGFEEAKIKEMLNKTDDLKNFDENKDIDLEKVKGQGTMVEEEGEKPFDPTIGIEKQTY